jgi:hypothetical protein
MRTSRFALPLALAAALALPGAALAGPTSAALVAQAGVPAGCEPVDPAGLVDQPLSLDAFEQLILAPIPARDAAEVQGLRDMGITQLVPVVAQGPDGRLYRCATDAGYRTADGRVLIAVSPPVDDPEPPDRLAAMLRRPVDVVYRPDGVVYVAVALG